MTETIIENILSKPRPLSKEQAAAVTSNSRFVRIVAGAGAVSCVLPLQPARRNNR
jgi:hypothetical protein